jgi:hypothetical protein
VAAPPRVAAPPTLSRTGQAALALACLGHRVFPLAPRSKRPLRAPGFHAATWDPATIVAWWTAAPACNIGLATGAGLIALDFDPAHGALPWWRARGHLLGPTVAARSGRGGWHLLLRVPPDCAIRNSVGKLAPGVDVRGDGGYLVVPPSIHPCGQRYRWLRGCAPGDIALAPLPADLVALLIRPPPRVAHPPARPRAADPVPEIIPMGQRNATLFSLAGTMRRRNASPAAIRAALRVENAIRCCPPLAEEEVDRIVRQICRYPPG